MKKVVLGGGCFWCTEAVFNRIKGVEGVVSGYAGGEIENPNYEHVSSGNTGHAEAIQVSYDPGIISYEVLLYIFFRVHDPTTLNRQGADVGSQYRSVIFYENEEEKKSALKALNEAQKEYEEKIVTKIERLGKFSKAEEEHQNFYERNQGNRYCNLVIDPKIRKLEERLSRFMK